MTSHVKQQLLLKQLHEVGDCFAQPAVNQVERLKKVSQLKACIANVEKVCDELHDSQQLLKQKGGGELLRQRLDEANAAFEREKARAEAAELASEARRGGSASAPEVRQLTARIVQLEKELAERTAQLEASAARLQASGTPRKGESSKEAILNQRVAALTREVEQRSQELEAVKSHSGDTQKQLWDARESLQALRQSREAEAERHHHEVEKLRQQIVDLQQSYPASPSRRASRSSTGTGALASVLGEEAAAELIAHADLPEADDSMSPEVLHYRRQLVGERQEQSRMRKERDDARSLLEYRSAELRRNQVRHPFICLLLESPEGSAAL